MRRFIFICGLMFSALMMTDHKVIGDEKSPKDREFQIVIDSVTRYIFKARPDAKLPLRNPKTGKETITRAFCCEKCAVCDRWKPVPIDAEPQEAPEKFHCPIHKEMMKPTGPIPNNLRFIE